MKSIRKVGELVNDRTESVFPSMSVQKNRNPIETIYKSSCVNHNICHKFVAVYISLPMLSFQLLYHTHPFHRYTTCYNFSTDSIYNCRIEDRQLQP